LPQRHRVDYSPRQTEEKSMHRFHPTALREYDIRGIVGQTLDTADANALGRSFGTRIARTGGRRVAVGFDGRASSPGFATAIVAGLNASGITAVRIGLGPTPMLYYAVHELGCDGGIMVTGSHNPPDYNGFKLLLASGPFYGADIVALGEMAAAGDWVDGAAGAEDVDLIDRYVARLVRDLDVPPFRIAWDAGNGAAGPVVDRLTKLIPGTHHTLFTDVDPAFPNHHPDPTEEKNLADLKRVVIDHGCDFGVAFDGDGDRIGAVDGQGRVVWGDQLLAILAEPVLAALPGATIIADVKASAMLFDRVRELGGVPLMAKTGHSLIKAKMQETGAPLAGEMSGHIFFAHDWYGFDDGLYAAVRLIGAIAASSRSLAALKDAMPPLVNTPELRVQSSEDRKFAVVAEVLARLRAVGADVDETDGARVTTADGWWLLRASNTQDVLVARAEATNVAALARLLTDLNTALAASGVDPVAVP
jgi:phosphomannomutase